MFTSNVATKVDVRPPIRYYNNFKYNFSFLYNFPEYKSVPEIDVSIPSEFKWPPAVILFGISPPKTNWATETLEPDVSFEIENNFECTNVYQYIIASLILVSLLANLSAWYPSTLNPKSEIMLQTFPIAPDSISCLNFL